MLTRLMHRLLGHAPSGVVPGPTAIAAVYQREGRIFVEPSHRTRWDIAGYWVAAGEVGVLDADAEDAALGAAVLAALDRCRLEVEPPPRDAKLEADLFRAMGVRSRRAAMTGTRSCGVEREAGALRIQSCHNGGTRGDARGYQPIEGTTLTIAAEPAVADVGAAVRVALERATIASDVAGTPREAEMRTLFEPALAPITFAAGFLSLPLDDVAAALAAWYAEAGIDRVLEPREQGLADALRRLAPLSAPFFRRVWVETGSPRWPTAYFDGFINGTDADPPISELAQRLGCEGLTIALQPDSKSSYGARTIALYGSEAAGGSDRVWGVSAVNDGGRWTWSRTGDAQPFEEEAAYAARRVADRLTADRLRRYATALAVPFDASGFGPRCVEDVPRRVPRDQRRESLAEARARFGLD